MPAGGRGTAGGALLGLLSAGLGLGAAFGFHLDPAQRDAITAFATAVLVVAPLVGALFDHSLAQATARQAAATTIVTGQPPVSPAVARVEAAAGVSTAEQLQARIDALTAERDRQAG